MNHGCSLEACRGFGRVEEVAPSDLKWSVKRKRGSLARLLWRGYAFSAQSRSGPVSVRVTTVDASCSRHSPVFNAFTSLESLKSYLVPFVEIARPPQHECTF